MSVRASPRDRASESYRANRSASLWLLEEPAEELAESRTGGGERHVVARHGARHCAVGVPLPGR